MARCAFALEEALVLEAIGELDEIFSYINAMMTARVNGHS